MIAPEKILQQTCQRFWCRWIAGPTTVLEDVEYWDPVSDRSAGKRPHLRCVKCKRGCPVQIGQNN